jgi:universal stress protein A
MDDVKRILVVNRSTRHCEKAVLYGVSLAKKYGAELHIVNVLHDPFSLEGWSLPVPSLQKEYERLLQSAKEDIDRCIMSEKTQGLSIKEWIKEGEPVAEILNLVKEEKIDLLLMLAHTEGRLEHFLFGRTNEELIRKMPCSIMLVKMKLKSVKYLDD